MREKEEPLVSWKDMGREGEGKDWEMGRTGSLRFDG